MKKFLKENEKSLWVILIIFILLMLNISSSKTIEYGLSSAGEPVGGVVTYSPALSLNKGKYDITVKSNSGSPVQLTVSAYTKKELVSCEFSGSEETITLDLTENLNGITFKTKGSTPVLHRVVVKSSSLLYTDVIYISLAIVIFLLALVWLKSKDEITNDKAALFIIISAAIVASYPLFTSYTYFGHDINFHLWRIEGIADGIRSGQFPVRIHPTHNNGYGYITASVYPELFLYFAAFLRLLGVSLTTSYNSLLFVINIATALIMYYSTKGITKSRFSAVIASVIYTLSTWRVLGLYARAAFGETIAMTFMPLVILGLYHVIKGDKNKWYILAIAYTCIFQSHVITTVLTAILSVVIALVFISDCLKDKRWIEIIKAIITTVLLNLWYLVPFVKYYFSLNMGIRNVAPNTEFFANAIIPAELFNIFNDSFGYSLLLPSGIRGNMSLSLGFTVSVCLVCAAAYFIFNKKEKLENESFTKTFFLCGIWLMFASTSLFPWQLLQQYSIFNKFAGLVRMPWRFLSVATPFITFAACHIFAKLSTKSEGVKKAIIFTVCAVSTLFMIRFGTTFTTNVGVTLQKCQTPAVHGSIGLDKEYLVKGTNETLLLPETFNASNGVKINSFSKKGTNLEMNITNTTTDAYVEVPLLYYPGYKATTESGEKLETSYGNNNVMRINIKNNTGNIKVKYTGFIYFRIAELVSLLTLLWLVFGNKIKKGDKKYGK